MKIPPEECAVRKQALPPVPPKRWRTFRVPRRPWTWLIAAAVPVLLRLALLPVAPPPLPYFHDEFSYLLGADTFAHGRLANPSHPMWAHLEAFHVNPIPTYASKYPPAQAAVLALGQVIFGHPWAGVLLGFALMCGATCWALEQWGPPWTALLISLLAGLHIGFGYSVHSISSHWLSTYWGGAVACAGGALVIGSLPALARTLTAGALLRAAVGTLILANSRPFEGAVLVLVCTIGVAVWRWSQRRTVPKGGALAAAWPAALLLLGGVGWMAYYNARVTGDALLFPYIVNQRMYARASGFWLSSELPEVTYRHEEIRRLYVDWDLSLYRSVRSDPSIMVKQAAGNLRPFLFPTIWLPGVLALGLIRRNARLWVALAILGGFTLVAVVPMKMVVTHYVAPAIPLVLIVVMHSFRVLQIAAWRRGRALRLAYCGWVAVCVLTGAGGAVAWGIYGSNAPGFATSRAAVVARLTTAGARHLVIVRRGTESALHEDWISNSAEIDDSPIVWARDMGPERNKEVLDYYSGRKKWLLEPDQHPVHLVPFQEYR